LRYRIAELAPHLLKYDYVEPTILGQIALQTLPDVTDIEITPLNDSIDVKIVKK
jgi:NADH dehydrogenase (ubiquinone) Fe-S protein 1